jgi:hypothetical protein
MQDMNGPLEPLDNLAIMTSKFMESPVWDGRPNRARNGSLISARCHSSSGKRDWRRVKRSGMTWVGDARPRSQPSGTGMKRKRYGFRVERADAIDGMGGCGDEEVLGAKTTANGQRVQSGRGDVERGVFR